MTQKYFYKFQIHTVFGLIVALKAVAMTWSFKNQWAVKKQLPGILDTRDSQLLAFQTPGIHNSPLSQMKAIWLEVYKKKQWAVKKQLPGVLDTWDSRLPGLPETRDSHKTHKNDANKKQIVIWSPNWNLSKICKFFGIFIWSNPGKLKI